jgi:protein phosphatase
VTAVLSWGAATDTGWVRETNEDSMLARAPVFVVADGMGGHAAGEVASSLAVGVFAEWAESAALSQREVETAILSGNERILEAAREHDSAHGMGTTIAGIAIVAPGGIDHWLVFNVGDSRVYRWAEGSLIQITVDHSEVQELIDRGEITRQEAVSHQSRNVVTRALGTDPLPEIDWWLLPVIAGERFLICSDGLPAELSDTDIEHILRSSSATEAATELVERAVAAGGRDNVTVITVDVTHTSESASAADEDTAPRPQAAPFINAHAASPEPEEPTVKRTSSDQRLISKVPGVEEKPDLQS